MDQGSGAVHKAAVGHLPAFITPPGQTDVLLNVVIVFLVCVMFLTGILYLRLHALPEHIAHRTHKVQIQLVAVLGLISLFTHNQIFWIAALLIAMTELPDFLSPITSMAISLRILTRQGVNATAIAATQTSASPPSGMGPSTGAAPAMTDTANTAQIINNAANETEERKQEQQ